MTLKLPIQSGFVPNVRHIKPLYLVIGSLMLAYGVFLLVSHPEQPARLVAPVLIGLSASLSWALHDKVNARTATLVFVWGVWLAIVVQAVMRNGVSQPAVFALPALFLLAGWVLGVRVGVALAVASMVAIMGLAAGETAGWLSPREPVTAFELAVPLTIVLLASLVAMSFVLTQHAENMAQAAALRASLEASVRQLSERELALQRSEQRFFKLNASNPLPVAVSRLQDGRYLYVNAAWERAFGWTAEHALGKTSVELDFWREPVERDAWVDAFRREGRTLNREMLAYTANRQKLDLLLNAELIDYDGEPAVLASFVDQTERKRIADELQRLNNELEARVEARTGELQLALDMLKRSQDELIHAEKLASLGSLVAGVAHELNTPIGNALVCASALSDMTRDFEVQYQRGDLRRSALEAYVARCREGAELTQRSLHRANELVHSFKQVAVDQSSERKRTFMLDEMLQEVVDTLRPNIKGKPQTIRMDIQKVVQMESYPGPLGQVVINLIMNALVHAFEECDAGEVALSTPVVTSDHVELVCTDNGKGIAPAHLPRIFDPFFTTRLGQGGSGLGLAIVHRLVTQVLKGDLSVDSKLGQGTRFTLRLPKVAGELPM
ncbi:MAG TPA: PAS domain-containing sensor histidine kinase [Burkholderiaceae bacterium]|nr:PAS domain-containing sensor histidine kinase [Burkholderiaceae bacterium]